MASHSSERAIILSTSGPSESAQVKRVVWKEFHEDIRAAIQRESNIKHWPRAWKVKLILMENPEWRDLFEELNW